MNSSYGITASNLMQSFPSVLADSVKINAIAKAAAKQMVKNCLLTNSITMYSRIDELPDELLDILAKDFKVDWWDSSYTLEEKRATLKSSKHVHRVLGTAGAVETALSAIFSDTEVLEWWNYNGDPFHFRILIDANNEIMNDEKYNRVLSKIACYKNLRSKLDGVEYFAGGTAYQYVATVLIGNEMSDSCTAYLY